MATFTVNADRLDPYKNFKFRVRWGNGKIVAAVSKVGPLRRTTTVVPHRHGGDVGSARKAPGRTEYEAITLERGLTHDPEFEQWARLATNYGAKPLEGQEMGLRDFRRNIQIELYNEAGQLVLRYKVFRCWVSEYQALADLDANADAVLIESLKIEHEGFERDDEVSEPTEPSLGGE
jgi:phage tail-like protein